MAKNVITLFLIISIIIGVSFGSTQVAYAYSPVGSITDGSTDANDNTFDTLDGATDITTIVIGGITYALVTSLHDDGVSIINITNPLVPLVVASFTDGGDDGSGGTFDELDGATGITTVTIGGIPYAIVAAYNDDGFQIINISNPSIPLAVASFSQSDRDTNGDRFNGLDGATGITTVTIDNIPYALIGSYASDGVQIINISDPSIPLAVTAFGTDSVDVNDDIFAELNGARGITTMVIGTSTYALVAAFSDDGISIIDISTPNTPLVVASIADGSTDDNNNTFDELDGATGITTVTINNIPYASS